jgi:hypothetical protein
MKVPGAELAFVDIAKIRDYSLNSNHRCVIESLN